MQFKILHFKNRQRVSGTIPKFEDSSEHDSKQSYIYIIIVLQVRSGEELSAREESALANMTLAEAEEGRRQLMRMRVLQSYQADKLKRQNKIKSKKYRKLLRKSREKVSMIL